MSTEREHAHDRKHDDDHREHDDRSVGRVNRSALLRAPEHPVTSGLVARKAARDSNGVEAGADQAIASAASSSGMALPSPIMRKFEASLGADLSGVRVHTGAESQTAASAVGAKAYTMGQDIHFGAGHYDPSSGAGEHLLAHEVAHTVQQRGGSPTRQNKLEVSTPHDAAEHEADHAADAMVASRPASVGSASGLAREWWISDALEAVEEAVGLGGDGKASGGNKQGAEAGAASSSQAGYQHHDETLHDAHGRAPAAADTALSNEWVVDDDADPEFKGEQEGHETTLTKEQLYEAITKVAPSLPYEFKVLLVGQAWAEQGGKGILNYNIAGIEGSAKAFVLGWTSGFVSRAQYDNSPDAYRDWDMKGHNPKWGVYKGKPCGTIQVQLDRGEQTLVVMEHKKRPAYKSLASGTAAFVREIERRIHALQGSSDESQRALAARALAGDAKAYGDIVSEKFSITGSDGKQHGFGAYNPDRGYGARVEKQIELADADLQGHKDGG